MDQNKIINILAGKNIRSTHPRLEVLKIIVSSEGTSISAVEILNALENTLHMNKTTVYRILDLFLEKGVIQKHTDIEGVIRYCYHLPSNLKSTHVTLICRMCGNHYCSQAEDLFQDLSFSDFVAEAIDINVNGLCTSCIGK